MANYNFRQPKGQGVAILIHEQLCSANDFPSLGMFQCRLQRILCDFEVIMFFRKDPPQTEGRRHIDPQIKTPPGAESLVHDHERAPPRSAHRPARWVQRSGSLVVRTQ